jgi:hypothetical protein
VGDSLGAAGTSNGNEKSWSWFIWFGCVDNEASVAHLFGLAKQNQQNSQGGPPFFCVCLRWPIERPQQCSLPTARQARCAQKNACPTPRLGWNRPTRFNRSKNTLSSLFEATAAKRAVFKTQHVYCQALKTAERGAKKNLGARQRFVSKKILTKKAKNLREKTRHT